MVQWEVRKKVKDMVEKLQEVGEEESELENIIENENKEAKVVKEDAEEK